MYKHLYAQLHDNEVQILSIIDYYNTKSSTVMIKQLAKLVYLLHIIIIIY